jgi:hypothetical protein
MGLAVTRQLTTKLQLGLEIFHQTPDTPDCVRLASHTIKASKMAWHFQNRRCSVTFPYPASTDHPGSAIRGASGQNATTL